LKAEMAIEKAMVKANWRKRMAGGSGKKGDPARRRRASTSEVAHDRAA